MKFSFFDKKNDAKTPVVHFKQFCKPIDFSSSGKKARGKSQSNCNHSRKTLNARPKVPAFKEATGARGKFFRAKNTKVDVENVCDSALCPFEFEKLSTFSHKFCNKISVEVGGMPLATVIGKCGTNEENMASHSRSSPK
uniref:Uncharacterized protein n=1 Tax=Romanomermis culicivorax TaxID=13658 RepID=A0A915JPB4_ROMCU